MNFFESQERAHKHTTLLIVLFGVAVIALIVMANLLALVVFGFVNSQQLQGGQTFVTQKWIEKCSPPWARVSAWWFWSEACTR